MKNKKKKNKNAEPTEEQMKEELIQALNVYVKEKEPEVIQLEKESEESKKLTKTLKENLSEIERLKNRNKIDDLYNILVKTVLISLLIFS